MAIQPTVFERTHSGGKEPTRYFTPTAVGSHFGRSASSILHDFESGKVQSLEAGPYRYKPVASRPGPMTSMTKESGLDRMTEPYQEARKDEAEEKISEKEVTPEKFKTPPKESWRGRSKEYAAKHGEADKKQIEGMIKPVKEAAKSAKLDLTPEQRKAGMEEYRSAQHVAKNPQEPETTLGGHKILPPRTPEFGAKPIKKAADDFSREEWTGMKPLDKPAPDHEKFLQTGEVSPEAKQKQGWWDRMKERLKFARAEDTDEKKLAEEKKKEYESRHQALESLPGYDDWKLSNREDERLRRPPIKKSAEEGEMEQSGGAHIDAGHVDVNLKKCAACGQEMHLKEAAKSDKFERCVHDVKRKDGSVNPWAVCHASTGE